MPVASHYFCLHHLDTQNWSSLLNFHWSKIFDRLPLVLLHCYYGHLWTMYYGMILSVISLTIHLSILFSPISYRTEGHRNFNSNFVKIQYSLARITENSTFGQKSRSHMGQLTFFNQHVTV